MLVRANYQHASGDGEIRVVDEEYELSGIELELRMKDQIVSPVAVSGPPRDAPPTEPEE